MGMARVIDPDEVGAWRYDCPVCGIELARSNFETPAFDYYCPVCTSRQSPRRWSRGDSASKRPLRTAS